MTISPTRTVLVARVAALGLALLGFALGPGGVATATATPRPALVSTSIADDERPARPDAVACDDDPNDPDPGDDGDDGDGD